MAIFAINYDLKTPGKDYPGLMGRLKQFPKWSHVQKSFWLIQTAYNKDRVYKELRKEIDSDDALFVMSYSHDGATWTANQDETTSDIQNTLKES